MTKKSETITIYQKPTCSTCREAVKLAAESGIPFTAVNFYETPFNKARLKELLAKAGLRPHDALRTKEEIYKELGIVRRQFSDDELIELMVRNPDLIQRPIVEKGDRAMLARPAEMIKAFLR